MLLLEEEFRELYVTDTATDVNSAQINSALVKAKNRIIGLVGSDAVSDAELETPANPNRADSIREAQALFAASSVLTIRFARIRDGGIIESEKDANGEATNKYASMTEIQKAKQSMESEALDLIGIYILPGEAAVEDFTIIGSRTVSKIVRW